MKKFANLYLALVFVILYIPIFYLIFCIKCVFIKRPKDLIVKSLLERLAEQINNEPSRKEDYIKDISNRILSLSDERKNEELCDRVILNNGDITDVIQSFF